MSATISAIHLVGMGDSFGLMTPERIHRRPPLILVLSGDVLLGAPLFGPRGR